MDREQVIAILRNLEPELKAAGVLSASLFGSVARGDQGPNSDVEVAVQLGSGFSSGGFDYFGRLDDLEKRLSRALGVKVDVVQEPVRKQRMQLANRSGPRPCLLACTRVGCRTSSTTRRRSSDTPVLMPDQPWHGIRALGSRLRRNYDTLDADQLFDIVRNDLPRPCASARAALAKLEQADETP